MPKYTSLVTTAAPLIFISDSDTGKTLAATTNQYRPDHDLNAAFSGL